MKKSLGLLTLTGLVVGLLAACGGATDHNNSDIAFAQGMVPHHEQAIVMADVALEKSENADVRALATQIKGAQDPEIETMKAWLSDWDADSSMDHAGTGMDHNGEGMMTDAEMKSLDTATGAAFDNLWLTLMIKHHEGAVFMADDELQEGTSPGARKLARQIIDAQNAEIATMKDLVTK